MPRARAVLAAAVTLAALSCAPARADIFAATEVHAPGSRTDLDVQVVNATTGAKVALPAGVNTTADELHPSITIDGKRLAFERRDSATGTVRIVVADLPSGQTSDVFTGFDAAQLQPSDPAITPGGQEVLTGGPLQGGPAFFVPAVTQTQVAAFPNGPYEHFLRPAPKGDYASAGRTDEVWAGVGGGFAVRVTAGAVRGDIALTTGQLSDPLDRPTEAYGHPALAAEDPERILFDARPIESTGSLGNGDIVFARNDTVNEAPTPVPGINTSLDESQPALTSGGRYVAFVRHETDHRDHLLVWDSETQTILNPDGVSLGEILSRSDGNVSLYTRTVIQVSHVALENVAAKLSQGSGLGILVQRIVGRHKVLGREEFKLRKVGRVPLGHFGKGRHKIHWKLRIHGRRLKPGRYLLTLRALNRHKVVTELAKPTVVRIRARHRPKKH